MADDRIRIDALNPTVLPSLDHVVPAMHDGLTVKLTIAQLRQVMLGGTSNVALALKDLSNTDGPRGKFGEPSPAGTDFNSLVENGVFFLPAACPNAPEAVYAYCVSVFATQANWATQYASAYGGDSPSDSLKYKRELNNNVWTAWYRVRETEDELYARLARRGQNLADLLDKNAALTNLGGNTEGCDIFKNASSLGATLAKVANDAAGRSALLAPAAPKIGAGVGQWTVLLSATGTAIALPAGGTWAYFWLAFNVSTNTFASSGLQAGFAAGGSLIDSGIANAQVSAVAWRIA